MINDSNLMTVHEAATVLRCGDETIRKYLKQGKLVRVPFPGRRVFVDKRSVEAIAKAKFIVQK